MSRRISFFTTVIGVFMVGTGTVSAQFSKPFSLGAGAGAVMASSDLNSSSPKFLFYGEADFLISPFISIGGRGEHGKLIGETENAGFENNYYAAHLNLKVRLGQFLATGGNYAYHTLRSSLGARLLQNIYIGAGGGLIKNRTRRYVSGTYADKLRSDGGELSRNLGEIGLIIPLHAGFDIPIGTSFYGPKWAVNVNFQHTLSLSDNLDGVIIGKNDRYDALTLGVKYAF